MFYSQAKYGTPPLFWNLGNRRVDEMQGSLQGFVQAASRLVWGGGDLESGVGWVGGLARSGGARGLCSPWTSDSYTLGRASRQLV